MNKLWSLIALVLVSFQAWGTPKACPKYWDCRSLVMGVETVQFNVKFYFPLIILPEKEMKYITVRAGMIRENPNVEFRGNVLYLQGFGDSMLNHDKLFRRLSNEGFRVISFDYMGQGGSQGKMNDSLIGEIVKMGDIVYDVFARDRHVKRKRIYMGWSTGALAAYAQASENKLGAAILISPYFVTRINMSAAGAKHDIPEPYEKPKVASPMMTPKFTSNLFYKGIKVSKLKVDARTPGLVLVAGEKDPWVSAAKTNLIMLENASHFLVYYYEHALHGIHNESSLAIRQQSHDTIVNFLLRL